MPPRIRQASKKTTKTLPVDTKLKIKFCQLFVYTLTNPRKPNIIYNDSIMTICKSAHGNIYQLVIERIFEEGEDDYELENFDKLDMERAFVISSELKFEHIKMETHFGFNHLFNWQANDVKGNLREYELVAPSNKVKEAQINNFLDSLNNAVLLYNMTKESTTTTTTTGTSESTSVSKTASTRGKAKADKQKVDKLSQRLSEVQVKVEEKGDKSTLVESIISNNATRLSSLKGRLCKFNEEENMYSPYIKVRLLISREEKRKYLSWLVVEEIKGKSKEILFCLLISSSMNAVFDFEDKTFRFIEKKGQESIPWLVQCDSKEELSQFRTSLTKAIYESSMKATYDNLEEKKQKYINKSLLTVYGDTDDDRNTEDETTENEEEEVDNYSSTFNFLDKNLQNKYMVMGYKYDRTFISRGPNIGAFRNGDENALEFIASVENIKDSKGNAIQPDKMLLKTQDSSMVLLSYKNPNQVYDLDIETGKIKQEIQLKEGINCINIFNSSKYSQITPEETFCGLSSKAIFTIDPRMRHGSSIVENEIKSYTTDPKFGSAVSTSNKEISVASEIGEIRLYNQIGKKATSLLPPIGEPILALDVSNDGQYLLATCKSSIIIIDTKIYGDVKQRTGFNKAFPKDAKPIPHRLQLRTEDWVRIERELGYTPVFTPAKFNVGENILERYILASLGPYLVLWNFRKVKLGEKFPYTLTRCEGEIVADGFRFESQRSVIVTLPDSLIMTSRQNLEG